MEKKSQKRKLEEIGCEPPLCANKCGFFGNPNTNNLCSKCYKPYFLNQTKEEESFDNRTETVEDSNKVAALPTPPQPLKEEAVDCSSSENPKKRPTNRCSFCRKKIGLMGFKCRCEETFCSIHRYSDEHNCVFNYKRAARDAIAKANPVVKADKVEKI